MRLLMNQSERSFSSPLALLSIALCEALVRGKMSGRALDLPSQQVNMIDYDYE